MTLERREAGYDILLTLRRPTGSDVLVVGSTGLVALHHLAVECGDACEARGLPRDRRSGRLVGGRRFPIGGHDALVDRVDAMPSVHGKVGLPAAGALLSAASGFLGHVVRDAALVVDVLRELPVSEGPARRAGVVSLGLLGVIPPGDLGPADSGDSHDMAAYVFAITLADLDQALPLIERAYMAASSAPAREVPDSALARLEGGDVLGVIG